MGAHDLLQHLRGAGFGLDFGGDKLMVAPAAALTDTHRQAIRGHRTDLLELLSAEREAEVAARQCADCAHLTRRRTCPEPEAAGLAGLRAIRRGTGYPCAGPAGAGAR